MAIKKAGPFVATPRAKTTPGRSVAVGGTQVIKPQKKGQKPVAFKKGGLHETTHTPQGEKIPESKIQAALRGEYGKRGKKQAVMATGLLKKGRKTASK